jgi:hypothetical protein
MPVDVDPAAIDGAVEPGDGVMDRGRHGLAVLAQVQERTQALQRMRRVHADGWRRSAALAPQGSDGGGIRRGHCRAGRRQTTGTEVRKFTAFDADRDFCCFAFQSQYGHEIGKGQGDAGISTL